MKILHLTDLHYSNKIGGRNKQQKLISNFIDDLGKNANQVDFVIFSGDLVADGSQISDFQIAKEHFLDVVLSTLKLNYRDLFICAGNHDVDRPVVSNSIIKYLDENIKSNKQLDDFFKTNKTDEELSHRPLKNYREFINELYADIDLSDDYFEEMYSTHIRITNSGKIGFVCFNTSWRAVGIDDDTNLLLPLIKVEESLDRISSCDIKIAIHHHPLNKIKPYNLYDLEDLLHKRFDFMYCGHVHKNNLSLDLTPHDGVVKLGTSANLSFDIESQIGYTIFHLNQFESTFKVHFRMYDSKNEVFYPLPTKSFKVPTSKIKEEQNKLRRNIRKRFKDELEESKNLFVESKGEIESRNLLELSTEPVLKNKTLSDMLNEEEQSSPDFVWSNFFNFNKDYIIYGKDKCGKTILLKKVELELLKDYSQYDYLPFYIDIKHWHNSGKAFDFEKQFAKYYFSNVKTARKLLQTKKVVVLVDNFHVEDIPIKTALEEIVNKYEDLRLIICSISHALSSFDDSSFDGRKLEKLYFHRLRKIHIKALTKKNYDLSKDREEEIVEKINTIFKKLAIPFNYWTVSIFLWVFNKESNNSSLHNDVDLINLYIEKLLEKELLTVSASTFTYSNYKKLLAQLAHYLLTKHHKSSYYAKYSEIIDFFQEQLDQNPRISTNPKDIFEYLDSRGLLRKKDPDMYSFRLNGVFEYFVAFYMTLDNQFLEQALEDKNYYLSFSNEFELYAGFKRDNIHFLNQIYRKTQKSFEGVHEVYDLQHNSLDKLLTSKIYETDQLGNLIEKYSNKFKDGLTEVEQDKIEEELIKEMKIDEGHSEIRKKTIKSIDDSADSLEEGLKILGKVYRNIDDINDSNLVYEIFDFIIDSACVWSYKLLDEFGDMDISDIIKKDTKGQAKEFLKLISSVIPTLVQVRLYDMMGHVNLESIIMERLEQAKSNHRDNQFKLFIYSFLLLDLNYPRYSYLIEELIPLIRIPIIKYSFILKLNYYLGFKNNLSSSDKKYLRNNLQGQYLRFNNKVDIGDVQRGISSKDKKRLER